MNYGKHHAWKHLVHSSLLLSAISKSWWSQAAEQTISELQQQLQSEVATAKEQLQSEVAKAKEQLQSEVAKAKEQEVALSTLTQDLQASAQVCSTLWQMLTAVLQLLYAMASMTR